MVYIKTELGQLALQNRASMLPRQRSAFILFDGKRSADDVLKSTAGLGFTADDIKHLLEAGLLVLNSAAPVLVTPAAPATTATAPTAAAGAPTLSAQEHYSRAYPIATRLTASLGLRGFRLNLAVEAAGDLAKLRELAPKIKDAVGPIKFKELEDALYY